MELLKRSQFGSLSTESTHLVFTVLVKEIFFFSYIFIKQEHKNTQVNWQKASHEIH